MHSELGDSVAWCSCGYRSPAISKTRTHWDSISNNSDPVRLCTWGSPGSFGQWHSNGADEAQKDCHTVGWEKNILEFTLHNCSRKEGFFHPQLPQAEPVNRASASISQNVTTACPSPQAPGRNSNVDSHRRRDWCYCYSPDWLVLPLKPGFSLCVPSPFSVLLNAIAMTCAQIDIIQLLYVSEKLLWQRFSNVIEGANEKGRHGLASAFCLLQATGPGTELLGMFSFIVF